MLATRRHFLQSATAISLAAPGYLTLASCGLSADIGQAGLISDPDGWLDLPEGFSYHAFSRWGEMMSDGLRVPADHDGMAAFAVNSPDHCVLIRNHEVGDTIPENGPFADDPDRAQRMLAYDYDHQGRAFGGGTTTMIYNVRTRTLERSWLSLAGTIRNCSGGATPWGSWLTCEETEVTAGPGIGKDHGYVFEAPVDNEGLAEPIPLKAMGRFNHEAAAVDPHTGAVYMTEDEGDGLLYRFLPNSRRQLNRGGRLQALVILDTPGADTRNWDEPTIAAGQGLSAHWVDLDQVESPDGDLRCRARAKGAAIFARGEGMAWASSANEEAVYFACTNGGPARAGQIWRYAPSRAENGGSGADVSGQLTLHYESPSRNAMDMCDNIVAAPWGHLIICEDGEAEQFVRGLTPDGRVYDIARNAHNDSEFAVACFSPDGTTLFVNMQNPGVSFAITGPWDRLSSAT